MPESINDLHAANQKRWDVASRAWATMHDERGTWRICHHHPDQVFIDSELSFLQDLSEKAVCVLGSGDNLASFALAGLGAQVTSVDISQAQLDVAARRADTLGLGINFLQADVCQLFELSDNTFDFVYTGGHVAVWVSDLKRYYAEAVRILKPGGLFVVNEYHPFRRVWKQGVDQLEVAYQYYDRGPFQFLSNEEIMGPEANAYPTYEFHWSVSDLINAILQAGSDLIYSEEHGEHVGDWEGAPLEGLPEYLLLVARKKE